MALIDEIKEQTVKLKDMTNKQKAEYIWHYYKWYILGSIFIIGCLISLTKTIILNRRPVYLFAEFINCNMAFDDTSTISEEFAKEYNVDTNKTPLTFDFNTILQDNAMDNTTNYANQMRLIAEINAEELDIIAAPEKTYYNELNGCCSNLEEVLPAGMLDELKAKGYELWSYTEAADPEYGTPEKTYVAGFFIDNCEYLNNQGVEGLYTVVDKTNRPIMTISVTSKNPEHAIEFINFITK